MLRNASLFLSLCLACGPQMAPTEDPLVGSTASPVTSWPTFSGDCQAKWSHTIKARNANPTNGTATFSLSDTVPGMQGFQAFMMLTFDPADIGVPLAMDQKAVKHIKVNYIIVNTTYLPYGDPGMIKGTVTVKSYQPPASAEFLFSNATLVGDDSVYAGTFRCGINGTLKAGFDVTALGARCTTDLQCGGALSGRICDDATFVCATGCHINDDCPSGHTCAAATNSCK